MFDLQSYHHVPLMIRDKDKHLHDVLAGVTTNEEL
jgi:hypothetical protein